MAFLDDFRWAIYFKDLVFTWTKLNLNIKGKGFQSHWISYLFEPLFDLYAWSSMIQVFLLSRWTASSIFAELVEGEMLFRSSDSFLFDEFPLIYFFRDLILHLVTSYHARFTASWEKDLFCCWKSLAVTYESWRCGYLLFYIFLRSDAIGILLIFYSLSIPSL